MVTWILSGFTEYVLPGLFLINTFTVNNKTII